MTLKEFNHKINNDWFRQKQKENLSSEGFEAEKEKYKDTADLHLILYALQDINQYIIVTEETKKENDGKLFKKIPLICDDVNIQCISLPKLLQDLGVGIQYKTEA